MISDAYDNINSDVGRCVPCLAGTYSIGSSMDGYMGQSAVLEVHVGSSACLECVPVNTRRSDGKIECDPIVLKR